MIVPTFARRPILGYTLVALAMVATGFISFGLWVHHMFAVGLALMALGLFAGASMSIAVPSGVQVFAWLGTIWSGRPVMKTPFLFVIGFILVFVLGGLTGVMVAAVPFNLQVHDTYFVVAHFHYVLVGGVVFPIFAALYYWMPVLTGRLLSERLGRWSFGLIFVRFNVAFFPMHISGLLGMPRRYYTYPADFGLSGLNLTSTIGTVVLAAGGGCLRLGRRPERFPPPGRSSAGQPLGHRHARLRGGVAARAGRVHPHPNREHPLPTLAAG